MFIKENVKITKSLDCHCPMGNAHARICAWEIGTGVPTRASENKFFSTNGLPAQFKWTYFLGKIYTTENIIWGKILPSKQFMENSQKHKIKGKI